MCICYTNIYIVINFSRLFSIIFFSFEKRTPLNNKQNYRDRECLLFRDFAPFYCPDVVGLIPSFVVSLTFYDSIEDKVIVRKVFIDLFRIFQWICAK